MKAFFISATLVIVIALATWALIESHSTSNQNVTPSVIQTPTAPFTPAVNNTPNSANGKG